MPKKPNPKERGFTQVGLPIDQHNMLETVAKETGTTRCGLIKQKITPMLLERLSKKGKK